ncbi:MFS transporter [Roseomonas populi]|uniref:MFS transporter n=1 Tax=Roseomonas populi TaxID=3121582 RepID=A0ABT1X4R4_9PROT|nr:MFS transporter [Roseomonas pecuniae]MCR0981934.1 MFS transporter [Roseomonas pecuniae]
MPRTILWLTLGAFAVGTGTFSIAGLLPVIAADLEVSVPAAGHLSMAFALAYAVASPVLAAATAAMERRRTLVLAMAVYALASAGCVLVPGYAGLMGLRVLAALAAALFTPMAGACAVALVEPHHRGRALALVIGGMTLSTVLGAPMGTLIGEYLGWRATFLVVGALGLLSALGALAFLPRLPGSREAGIGERLALVTRPAVATLLVQTVVVFTGAFTLFSYLAPFVRGTLGFVGTGTALALLLSGLGGLLGVSLGGWAADRQDPRRFLILSNAVLGCALAGISLCVECFTPGVAVPTVLALLVVWGASGWCFPAVQQARLVALSPALAPVLLSLNASATYVGTSLGALFGGLVIGAGGLQEIGLVAGGIVGIGAAMVWGMRVRVA